MECPPIKVLVVEDQPKILKNQLKLLDGASELSVVGTAMSGEEALQEIPRCQPDVILLDLGLPKMSGIDVTREVKAVWPEIEILIFTIFDEEQKVLEAIRAGASGYLLKGATADKIVEAICDVRAGGTVIQPNLARILLKHFRVDEQATSTKVRRPAIDSTPLEKPLSEREMEILQLIAKGVSNHEAAAMLKLSKATIRTHLEHIYVKLDVTNRVEAVTEGIRKGLIDM
ncbi:MAG: response regulator transcription factor [Myxococcaceae bacterium]|nr:response regulator transcription factor [Myxococcaceae bacterium]